MKTTKKQTDTAKKKPPNAGKGRPPGASNKITREVKQMILDALDAAGGKGGGVAYLTAQAKKNPKSFLTLVGKVLPLQLTGANDGPVAIVYGDVNSISDQDLLNIIEGRNVKPNA